MAQTSDQPCGLSTIRSLQASLAGRSEFSLRLGRAYLDMGLLDAALSALVQIPDEGEEGQHACRLRLEVLARQGAHASVLELGRQLAKDVPESTWPWSYMANAAFATGDRARAEEATMRALAYLPSGQDVVSCLAEAEPGAEQPEPLALVRACADVGVGPHATIDCLLPVLWNARPTACLFEDGIEFVSGAAMETGDVQHGLLGLARYLFTQYGIRTAFLRYGAVGSGTLSPMGKAYFSRTPDLHQAVDRLEHLHWEEFRRGEGRGPASEQALRAEGALLGYPDCCVEWAARLREAGETIEAAAATALTYEEGTASVLEDPRVPAPAAAYYAFEFYPCDPRCLAAEARGHHMLERYTAAGVADLVRDRVIRLNKWRIWQMGRVNSYPQFVRAFNAELFTASLPDWQRNWLQASE